MKHYWGGCVVAFLMAACAGSVSRADDGKSPAERPPATRPGRVIAGVVLDPQGKPVPHADVTPDSFGGDSAVETDEQGRFQLTGVAAGKVRIKAMADGFAPQAREVSVAADMKPVELRLEKGRVLRGRVVEGNDKPVANATVSIERWQNVTGLGVYLRTDAEGRFAWNDAPPDAVTLAAHKQGYPEAPTIEFTAGEQECRIALKPASVVNVAGTVLDDATGKPIDRFRVYVTATGANGRTWLAEASGAAGKYEAPINRDAESYSVRIEADDYLTTTSPHLRAQNGPLGFSARIRKPQTINGVVRLPDGKPASGAQVILRGPAGIPLRNGALDPSDNRPLTMTTTDAAGRFALPPRGESGNLLVLHDAGWAEVKRDEANGHEVTLRSWCRVEGRVLKGDKPVVGQQVSFQPILPARAPGDREISVVAYVNGSTVTDADGRFVFARIADGVCEISVLHYVERRVRVDSSASGFETELTLRPGDRRTLKFGGTGRPVVGRVVVPEDLKTQGLTPAFGRLYIPQPSFVPPAGWEEMLPEQKQVLRDQFHEGAEYRGWAERPHSFVAVVGPDGAFRADDVPAGEYILSIDIQTPTPGDESMYRQIASAEVPVTIPRMPGGRSDEALDVGLVTLKPHYHPDVGAPAPPLELATMDGKPVHLADFKGKYVLLDFWATWCGPCIAEMKHIDRLNASLAGDDRLVLIGVSIDDRADKPARFLHDRKYPWLQTFAGPTAARQTFGVSGIPSVWLIGPDGKILAKEVPSEKLDDVVKNALSPKSGRPPGS